MAALDGMVRQTFHTNGYVYVKWRPSGIRVVIKFISNKIWIRIYRKSGTKWIQIRKIM